MSFPTFFQTLKNKTYGLLYKTVLYRFGYGAKVSKVVWEKEYSGSNWDFLFSNDEKAHNLQIIKQIKDHSAEPKLLDIGCGGGALYSYLVKSLPAGFGYTGIDISENAIKKAVDLFENTDFRVVNYDISGIDARFDIGILNEVLYYFSKPIKTLHKVFHENIGPGGVVIISMYADSGRKNQWIWDAIDKEFNVLTEDTVINDKGAGWKVKTIVAK